MIVLLVAVGLGMRVWRMSGVTLDHFDEGVYAFSALGVSDGSQPHLVYPNQEMFSPPLYFGMGGMVARVFGVAPDHALLILSILFGTLTIALVWWLGRQWFGPGAGLAAAAILALSPFHIAFSRSALTDITFTFWLVCALGALVIAVERGSFGWGVIGGIATGLAWNTKYHGWFALVITGGALVPYVWRLRHDARTWRRSVAAWAIAVVTASVCYLPWMIYLRTRPGGYQGMAQHYLGMLRTAWVHNFFRYGEMLAYFEAPASRIAIAGAVVLALAFTTRARVPAGRAIVAMLLLLICSLGFGSAGTTLLLSAGALAILLRKPVPFAVWVLFAWIGLWVVAAPVYRPYARLVLPFTVATAIGAGAGLVLLADWLRRTAEQPVLRTQWAVLTGFAAVTTSLAFVVPTPAQPWPPERGMGSVADSMARFIPRGSRLISVREPTPAYYLHRAGRPAFERNGGFEVLDTLSTPAYVITGTYVRRSPKLQKQLAALARHLVPIGTFNVRPYDVRILDDLSPVAARHYRAHPDTTFDLHLFRYLP